MKLSKRGEYGILALVHLAARPPGTVVQIREIAREEGIPAKFLEGILLQLKRAGLVRSRRGVEGGYSLARPAADISLGEVVRLLEGPLAPMGSAAELEGLMASHPARRGFYGAMLDVRNAVASVLDRTSLEDVVARNVPPVPTPPAEGPATLDSPTGEW
jgi:Rrf2 family protein